MGRDGGVWRLTCGIRCYAPPGQGLYGTMVAVTGGNRNDVTQLLPLVDALPAIRGRRGRPRRQFPALQRHVQGVPGGLVELSRQTCTNLSKERPRSQLARPSVSVFATML